MKFWRALIPNLCISLWLALLTLVILDQYNPMMGFMAFDKAPLLILVGLCAFSSLACAITLYGDFRRAARRRRRRKVDGNPEDVVR